MSRARGDHRVHRLVETIGTPPKGQRNISFLDLKPGGPLVTVQKSGRTTGLTKGVVTATSYDINMRLAFGLIGIRLRDQIQARGPAVIADGGDSGALVLDDAAKAVGSSSPPTVRPRWSSPRSSALCLLSTSRATASRPVP